MMGEWNATLAVAGLALSQMGPEAHRGETAYSRSTFNFRKWVAQEMQGS
jgi:hypothetical protein